MFWHKLALALGRTVREAKDSMDAEEFKYWMAYYAIDPWGEERGDIRSAIIATTVSNANPYRRGGSARVDDFLPFADSRVREMTDEEMMREVERGFALITGR